MCDNDNPQEVYEELITKDRALEVVLIERIEQLLKERNMSKYRLAQVTGIAQASLSTMFSGKNAPSLATLEKICTGLGLSYAEFFKLSGNKNRTIDTEERKVLELWHKLSDAQKKMVMGFAYGLEAQSKVSKL